MVDYYHEYDFVQGMSTDRFSKRENVELGTGRLRLVPHKQPSKRIFNIFEINY